MTGQQVIGGPREPIGKGRRSAWEEKQVAFHRNICKVHAATACLTLAVISDVKQQNNYLEKQRWAAKGGGKRFRFKIKGIIKKDVQKRVRRKGE